MATIATLTAVLYNYFRIDKIGLTFKAYALYCVVSAVCLGVFAKVLFAISYLPTVGFSFENFFHYIFNGGIVFYGGLFGLAIGIIIVSRFLHNDSKFILDYFSPSFPLFHSIARIGCLLGGCCYGIPWHWGVTMAESPDVVRFPVQIAESLCCFGIFVFLTIRAKRRENYEGSFRLYLFLYACCRFILEFFRGDIDRGIWVWGLSTSQIISLIIIVVIILRVVFSKATRTQQNA